jgi:ABC-2 type transport system ATP-binding protein
MSVLAFDDVHRRFRPDEEVLSGITFSLEEGEVVGLLGRNGAGKTTLIHIAMGMIRAQGGAVRVFGLDPQAEPVAIKRRVGFVSENHFLPPAMRVDEVVDFHRRLYPTWDAELERTLRERFTFAPRARIRTLSKGQARQLALLCAVAHRPDLLLLDEPAGGLDPAARREFLETAIRLLGETGTTILFSSHHMADVERMAERVVLLEGHRVMIDAPLDELREDCTVALLPADAVPGARLAELDGCLRVREHFGSLHAVYRGAPSAVASRLEAELGVTDASCRTASLEELFVELVGGDS